MKLRYEYSRQFGRSMVEILGVLVIIGLISAGGLHGYRKAVNKHKANELTEKTNRQAVLVAAQIASRGAEVEGEEDELNEMFGDFDDEGDFSVARPRRGDSDFKIKRYREEKKFAVVVPEMEKEECQEILNSLGAGSQIQYLVDKDGHEIEDCSNANLEEVEVVYNEDLSPAEADPTKYSSSDKGYGKYDDDSGNGGSSSHDDSGDSGEDSEDGAGDSDTTCPRGTKVYGEGKNCIACEKFDNCGCKVLGTVANGKGRCTCPDDVPVSDGQDGCVECTTGRHCVQKSGMSGIFSCVNNKCVTGMGCDIDNPIYSKGHCCPKDKPYWNDEECVASSPLDKMGFEGMDGLDYPCDTDFAVNVNKVKVNCSVCENREVLNTEYGSFCVPKCNPGQFLMRRDSNTTKPKVYCESCNANTGWMDGPFGCGYCSQRCPNRECYNLGFNPQFQCQLKECPPGQFACRHNGCCGCNALTAPAISGRYNAEASCKACNGTNGKRLVSSSGYCYLENCPPGTFRSGLDCISCTDNKNISTTQNECNKCQDANGKPTRHFERGYCNKGNICANGQPYSTESGCGVCNDNEFFVDGSCVSCDNPNFYTKATDETECNRCNGKREMKRIKHTDNGDYYVCMLKAEVGKSFYSNAGTRSCDYTGGGVVHTRINYCLDNCPNRIVRGEYTCTLPCNKGEFMGVSSADKGVCYSCDVETSYPMGQITERKDGVNVKYNDNCTERCPGKRFVRDGFCVKCLSDGTRYRSQEECESCLGEWDDEIKYCLLPSS